jgi:hypothetical protein
MVPASRAEVRGPISWFLWAFFGNDHGGLYGERDHYATYYAEHGPSLWLAIQWWCRNPMANLMKEVLAWKRDGIEEVVDWDPGAGWTFFRHRAVQEKWLGDGPQFTIAWLPPGIFWRNILGTEGYWLWHSGGWFCVLPTIRRTGV